jgi:hypothetical protein
MPERLHLVDRVVGQHRRDVERDSGAGVLDRQQLNDLAHGLASAGMQLGRDHDRPLRDLEALVRDQRGDSQRVVHVVIDALLSLAGLE